MTSESMPELGQNGLFGTYRLFQLGTADKLHVASGDRLRHREYTISLIALAPHRHRHFKVAWRWLAGAGLAMLIAAAALAAAWYGTGPLTIVSWAVAGVAGAAAVACIAVTAMRSCSELVYHSRHAGVPLLTLWAKRPSREAVETFARQLEQRIQALQQRHSLSIDQQLAGELRMLRRLVSEGAFTAETYEEAKRAIFQRSDSVSIEQSQTQPLG